MKLYADPHPAPKSGRAFPSSQTFPDDSPKKTCQFFKFLLYSKFMSPSLNGFVETSEMNRLIRGKRIRFYRVEAGLTLEQLGTRVGVGPSQLSLIENGRREPKLSLLE